LGSACISKDYEALNDKLEYLFEIKERFVSIYNFYAQLTHTYAEEYKSSLDKDYGIMVKQEINTLMFEKCFKMGLGYYPDKQRVMDYVRYE